VKSNHDVILASVARPESFSFNSLNQGNKRTKHPGKGSAGGGQVMASRNDIYAPVKIEVIAIYFADLTE